MLQKVCNWGVFVYKNNFMKIKWCTDYFKQLFEA